MKSFTARRAGRPVETARATGELGAHDGIEALIGDHRRCEALFQRVRSSPDPDPSAVRQIIRELSVHDAIESEYLYPLVEHRLPDGNRLAVETLGEHVEMAQMLAEIDGRPCGDGRRRALLGELIDVSRRHFAAEEATLLLPLHRHLAPEELARLELAIRTARRKAPTHPHPHAPRFSVGTHAAAAFFRPIDRLRDMLRRRP
jgi:hypothetical protein